MNSLARSLVSAWMLATGVSGQSLHVPASTADRKTPGVFSIILDSPPGKQPVALQWEISVPPAIAIGTADIGMGKAAESAHKSLTCAASAKKPATQGGMRYACILAGGKDPIGDGPIVTVHYRAQADVQGAPIRVVIENVLGVSTDLTRLEIANVGAIINIR